MSKKPDHISDHKRYTNSKGNLSKQQIHEDLQWIEKAIQSQEESHVEADESQLLLDQTEQKGGNSPKSCIEKFSTNEKQNQQLQNENDRSNVEIQDESDDGEIYQPTPSQLRGDQQGQINLIQDDFMRQHSNNNQNQENLQNEEQPNNNLQNDDQDLMRDSFQNNLQSFEKDVQEAQAQIQAVEIDYVKYKDDDSKNSIDSPLDGSIDDSLQEAENDDDYTYGVKNEFYVHPSNRGFFTRWKYHLTSALFTSQQSYYNCAILLWIIAMTLALYQQKVLWEIQAVNDTQKKQQTQIHRGRIIHQHTTLKLFQEIYKSAQSEFQEYHNNCISKGNYSITFQHIQAYHAITHMKQLFQKHQIQEDEYYNVIFKKNYKRNKYVSQDIYTEFSRKLDLKDHEERKELWDVTNRLTVVFQEFRAFLFSMENQKQYGFELRPSNDDNEQGLIVLFHNSDATTNGESSSWKCYLRGILTSLFESE